MTHSLYVLWCLPYKLLDLILPQFKIHFDVTRKIKNVMQWQFVRLKKYDKVHRREKKHRDLR